MKIKKTATSLLCASMLWFNASAVSADPGISNTLDMPARQVKYKTYNFDEFFKEKFQWQDSIEDLLSYTYSKYNHAVKAAKISYPGITLQDILDNANYLDKIKFWFLLVFDYSGNLNKLGYKLENVLIEKDEIKLLVLDKKRNENRDTPYLKMDIDVDSLPSSLNVSEIKKFLDGNDISILKRDKNGEFFYSIERCRK